MLLLVFIIFLAIIILDLTKLLRVTNNIFASVLLTIFSHGIAFITLMNPYFKLFLHSYASFIVMIILISVFSLYFLIRLHAFVPKVDIAIDLRLKIMSGGRKILLIAIVNSIIQIPFSYSIILLLQKYNVTVYTMVADVIVVASVLLALSLNGLIRIFFTSKYIRLYHRILLLVFLLFPVINLILAIRYCAIVKREFDNNYNKIDLQNTRAELDICKTTYPLLMLHGIGFRDFKYINYWGRIPRWLKKNGAKIFYGNQHAWGTIENNAHEIKEKIHSIMNETGADKVNIIAHSKGGLDARYCISSLDMGKHVASLTTISTPHRGSELIIVLSKLGDKVYRRVTNMINKNFKFLGDDQPDAYTSSKQLHPKYLEEFNKKNPDFPDVYYQSYMSNMKSVKSDGLLSVPFIILKIMTGDNDGLVSLESAKWGEFKGYLTSESGPGVSHGGAIDLLRKDYEDFDITEKYIEIVSELKEKGF